MTRSKAVILAIFVAVVAAWMIHDHSAASWIALAVMVVSMAGGFWYARRPQAS